MEWSWLAVFVVVLGLNVEATARGRRALAWVTKPLLTLSLLAFYAGAAPRLDALVMAALVAGLAGDVLLQAAARGPWFLFGLVAFLGGHLAYGAAFLVPGVGVLAWWMVLPALGFVAVGVVVSRRLAPGLGAARLPVMVYLVVIVGMAVASVTAVGRSGPLGWVAVAGAALFVASDTLIALARFGGAPPRPALVMATYGLAQLLLVLSFTLG